MVKQVNKLNIELQRYYVEELEWLNKRVELWELCKLDPSSLLERMVVFNRALDRVETSIYAELNCLIHR